MKGDWDPKRAHRVKVNKPDGKYRLWPPLHDLRRTEGLRQVLNRDFLIVSRLPFGTDTDVVMITGAHGSGVRAFELLFDHQAFPLSQVQRLAKTIGSYRHFQVLLEVRDVDHSGEVTRARKLAIPDDEDLQPFTIDQSSSLHRHSSTSGAL